VVLVLVESSRYTADCGIFCLRIEQMLTDSAMTAEGVHGHMVIDAVDPRQDVAMDSMAQ